MTELWWIFVAACSAVFLLGNCWAAYALRPAGIAAVDSDVRNGRRWLIVILCGGLLVRAVLAAAMRGHGIDVGTFTAWAGHAAEGLTSFYSTPDYFADYPPGYIYVLWVIGKLRALLGLEYGSPQFLLLLKSPAIIADIITAWVLYRLARLRWSGTTPTILAALYVFNPAIIIDSAGWGQVDSVLTLFILLGVLFMARYPAVAAAMFAIALLVKPQALIFAPVPVLWLAVQAVRRRDARAVADIFIFFGMFAAVLIGLLVKREALILSPLLALWLVIRIIRHRDARAVVGILKFIGAFAVVFILGSLPFTLHKGAWWIVEKYSSTMASYPQASLNACNIFALVGANGTDMDATWFLLPFKTWATIFLALVLAYTVLLAWRAKDATVLWYLPLFLSASVFMLSVKMHERYLYPAVALSLGFFIVSRSRLALWLFAGFSLTQFLNIAQVLALSYHEVYYVPPLNPLLLSVSGVNMLLWILLAAAGCRYVFNAPIFSRMPRALE